MRFGTIVCLGALVMMSMPGWAEEKRIYTRETTGIIRSINLVERQAIISGYKYYFGNPVYSDAADVDMYGSNYGSFEMLRVGMNVHIRYAEYGNIRYVVKLQQLSDVTQGVER